jgi:amino acid permease
MSISEKTFDEKGLYNVQSADGGQAGESYLVNAHDPKQTKRHLLPRHIQLIAISGAIGTGLFVSTWSVPSCIIAVNSR